MGQSMYLKFHANDLLKSANEVGSGFLRLKCHKLIIIAIQQLKERL